MPDRQQPARSAETEASLHDQVRREQARLLLDRARLPNQMTLPASLLVAWVLWPYVEHAVVLGWLAAKLLVGAIRFFIDRRAMREGPSRVTFWGARYEVAMAADGVLFGMLGTLLLPPGQPLVSVAMAATVLGIAAIGGIVMSSNWRACVAYTLPLMVPATVQLLLQGERIPTYLGLGMTLFLVLLVLEVRKATAHTQAMLRLRFQVDDLGAQRQAALELAERSNAAKSQFLATISHEMRTPLHVTLERTGDHLLGIINDVLDYSKIESGHLRLVEQDFELGAVLRSCTR